MKYLVIAVALLMTVSCKKDETTGILGTWMVLQTEDKTTGDVTLDRSTYVIFQGDGKISSTGASEEVIYSYDESKMYIGDPSTPVDYVIVGKQLIIQSDIPGDNSGVDNNTITYLYNL